MVEDICSGKPLAIYVWKDDKSERFKNVAKICENSSLDPKGILVRFITEQNNT
jgi:hypothetical protein